LDGVLGDVELALDSFGEDAIEQVEDLEQVSEKTESELHPPPGDFIILLKNIQEFYIIDTFLVNITGNL
jgi:hypothetical protein